MVAEKNLLQPLHAFVGNFSEIDVNDSTISFFFDDVTLRHICYHFTHVFIFSMRQMPTRPIKICSRCSMSPIFLQARKRVFHVWENRTYQFWEQWDKLVIGKYLWSVLYSWFSALWVLQTEVPNNYFSSQLPDCNNYDGQITDYCQKIKSWSTTEQQKKEINNCLQKKEKSTGLTRTVTPSPGLTVVFPSSSSGSTITRRLGGCCLAMAVSFCPLLCLFLVESDGGGLLTNRDNYLHHVI